MCYFFFFFFKQKTAYEMRISDWSSDVCSSDLPKGPKCDSPCVEVNHGQTLFSGSSRADCRVRRRRPLGPCSRGGVRCFSQHGGAACRSSTGPWQRCTQAEGAGAGDGGQADGAHRLRSEEHTSELQSLMRISYAVFCLKQKTRQP